MSSKTTQSPPARPALSSAGHGPAGRGTVNPAHSVRTPWGKVAFTNDDRAARDPLEPDAPIGADAPPERFAGPRAASGETLSPRELYEMLMTPAANPTRSSPARTGGPVVPPTEPTAFPPQADMVLSALEAGRAAAPKHDRRVAARRAYRVRATLRLYSDQAGTPAWSLYTRDVHSRGLGFITPHRLPLGYGGIVELPDPAGGDGTVRVPCTLLRCREAAPGWFEGSLYFNREQPDFDKA